MKGLFRSVVTELGQEVRAETRPRGWDSGSYTARADGRSSGVPCLTLWQL